ncbi:MAG: hypothetical protein M0Q49_02270 [Porticoccaceae bacterium]|nr:hypothetical protein [Porticoccaceae bacterium]
MSSAADAALLVARLITALDAAIRLANNSAKYRALVAKAVADGRDLTADELDSLQWDAQAAVDRLGD